MRSLSILAAAIGCCAVIGHAQKPVQGPPARGGGPPSTAGTRGGGAGRGRANDPNPQQPKPDAKDTSGQTRFRSGVDMVEVDVSVLDQDRAPVRGLTPADFTIREEFEPQEIVTFSEVDVPEPVQPPAVWMREVSPDVKTNSMTDRRLFVLVLDDAMTQPNPLITKRIKDIGHSIIDRFGPSDLAAVIFTLDDKKSQDFTSDRARLLSAVDKFSPGFGGGELFDRYPLNTMDKVAEYLTDLPLQRKALIYVSPGVPVDLTQAPTVGVFGDATGHAAALAAQMSDIYRMAARANVSVYAIDPSGLDATATDPMRLPQEMLKAISGSTGGFAIVDHNQFDSGINQIFSENSSYYLLGYKNPNTVADGKFRKLDIQVNRPGLTVHSRSGYYTPKPDNPKAPPPPSPLVKAITGLVPIGDLEMRLNVSPFEIPGKSETALAIVLGLRQPAPTRDAKVTETVNLSVNAFDPLGHPKGSRHENATLVLLPGPDDEVRYEVMTRLDLKPGHYQLRLAAFSASLNKAGSIYSDIEVPDLSKDPVSLSGVLISATPALAAGPPAPQAFGGLLPVPATTQREFAGHTGAAFLRVYQTKSKSEDVQMKVKLIDINDEVAFEQTTAITAGSFGADHAADFRFEIPFKKLKPGPYDLTFDALLANGKFAHRDVEIIVR